MDPAFSYRGLKLKIKEDLDEMTSHLSEVNIRQENHFAEEMDGFSRAILENSEIKTPPEMGIADMKITLAVYESARTGMPVKLTQ
jgi:predicted dehydrogenase